MSLTAGLLIIVVCLVLQGFFSGSEIAMVHANRLTLSTEAERGQRGAKKALDLLSREELLIATCLIGTNLCLVTSATVAEGVLGDHGVPTWAVPLVVSPVILLLGEALPKTVYQHHATWLAPYLAVPLTVIRTAFTPFLVLVTTWTRVMSAITGGNPDRPLPTREELLEILDSTADTAIDAEDKRMIRGLFTLGETTAEECMTPLVAVHAVRDDASIGVAIETALRVGHSRLPIYSRRIDHIVGVVHQADLLFEGEDDTRVGGLARKMLIVPGSKRADDLLQELREHGEHMAVVVDEYGGCVGVVTVEDLVEVMIGDIQDEVDRDEPAIRRLGAGRWSIPGGAELDDVMEICGVELPDGDYETLAGLVLTRLGRIPTPGDEARLGDTIVVRIESATDRAVTRMVLIEESVQPPPS